MDENIFYFLNIKREVKPDIFWEDVDDASSYFPLVTKVHSELYGTLRYPANGLLDVYESRIGLDKLKIDDQSIL